MARGFAKQVKDILRAHGCEFVRSGMGDHEVWRSPHAARPFVVDGKIMSSHMANVVLKQPGLKVKFD